LTFGPILSYILEGLGFVLSLFMVFFTWESLEVEAIVCLTGNLSTSK
jgi:hypothetical protein